jgi:hypothetical protein
MNLFVFSIESAKVCMKIELLDENIIFLIWCVSLSISNENPDICHRGYSLFQIFSHSSFISRLVTCVDVKLKKIYQPNKKNINNAQKKFFVTKANKTTNINIVEKTIYRARGLWNNSELWACTIMFFC